MKVIITRPSIDAVYTSLALIERDLEPVLAPLMTIDELEMPKLPEKMPQALLFTSANGVRAFAALDKRRNMPAYTVGAASGERARMIGFETVHHAGGDVESLCDLVQANASPGNGALWHVAGKVVSGDLKATLEKAGFEVERITAYEAKAALRLPNTIKRLLEKEQGPTPILFYSPRTARIFSQIVTEEKREQECQKLISYCLSPAVEKELEGLPFAATKTPLINTQSALLDLLEVE